MRTKLTDRSVDAWKAEEGKRVEVPDALAPGLVLVVQPSGAKSWAYRYRHERKPVKFTIGPYPKVSLRDARDMARDLGSRVARGENPSEERRRERFAYSTPDEQPRSSAPLTWWEAVERFRDTELAGLRSRDQVMRALERETREAWGTLPIADIRRSDVQELIDSIAAGIGRKRGPAPVSGTRTLAYLKWVLTWAVRREYVGANVARDVDPPTRDYARRRDRVLSDDELRDVWHAALRLGWPFGPVALLLVLTGARLREIAELRWDEVDLEKHRILVSAERMKNGTAHTIPLAPSAVAILQALPRHGRFVFSVTGETPVSGFGPAKRRIDRILADGDNTRTAQAPARAPWVFHDLRRTVASGLARLRVPFEVVERVLAHRGESGSGLRAVYNRHSYEDEKREALLAWANHVSRLVGASRANVVPLRPAEGRRR